MMVPNGWKQSTIANISKTTMGFAFKSADFVKDGVPLIRMGNLYQNQLQFDRNPVFLPHSYISEYEKFVLRSGDLVMSMTGTMGKRDYGFTVQIPNNSPECLLNQRVMKFDAKSNSCKEFLLDLLKSEYVLDRLYSFPGGTKQANLSAKQVGDIPILLPPLPEQQKIAKILSTWDKALATTERLIATSQQQKKALMQQLLTGKKRLVNPDTEMVFEGDWERHSLSDLVHVDKKSLGKKTPDDFEFKYISLSDVATGTIGVNLEIHKYATAPSRARRVLQNGDILLSTVRPNLKGFAKISEKHADCIASTGFSVLTPKKRVSGDYIYQYIFSSHVTGQIDSLVVGSNYPAINSSDVASLKVYCPTYEEQQKIASVLTAADKEIELLEAKLAHLKDEKKALMQQLLTGKRRVKVDDMEAA